MTNKTYEWTDDLSLSIQLKELGAVVEFFRKSGGGGKKKLTFINSAGALLDSMAAEFSNRKLDLGAWEDTFHSFPVEARIYVYRHAAASRTEAHELQPVFSALNQLALDGREGSVSAKQTISANRERLQQCWTSPPPYLNEW